MDDPGQNTGVGSLFLLQGIFLTQGSNPGLPHHKQILYQLSHQGSEEYKVTTHFPLLYEFAYSGNFIWMELYNVCPFESDFFYLV